MLGYVHLTAGRPVLERRAAAGMTYWALEGDLDGGLFPGRRLRRWIGRLERCGVSHAALPPGREGNFAPLRPVLPDGLRLDFDVNFYEGRTDYELELEFFPEAHERARLLLQELGIPEKAAGDVGDGKATRFFTAREGRPESSVTADLGFSGRIDGKAKKGIEDKIGRKEAVGHG